MPIYEYKCEGCGDVFEVRQRFADEPLTTHDKCGGPVHRLISAPALQFKGSGWYVTDYGKGNSGGTSSAKTETKTDSSSGSKTDSSNGSTSTSSESKPASSDSSSKSDSK